ncbi:MAG: hypothetical protein ACRDDX_12185 [Cellulosilyticaceae bacterium]
MGSSSKKQPSDSSLSNSNSLKYFLFGLVLTALGVYMIFQTTSVTASWYT